MRQLLSAYIYSWINRLLWPLLLAALWLPLLYILSAQWLALEQYSYGWSVPLLCLFLIWQRIEKADSRKQKAETHLSFHLSQFQLFALALCALLWLFARWLLEANSIWRPPMWVLALEAIGLTLWLLRLAIHGSRFTIHDFIFPVCFFLVAVPWPYHIEQWVTDSLTWSNTAATIDLLNLIGTPALQHGNVIEVATGRVGIDDACSGIRSFQATLMISLFLGEFYRLSASRRSVLCLAGLTLAFVFNICRTSLLSWVAARDGVDAIAKWHDPAGVTILVGCFISLWLIGLAMRRNSKSPQSISPTPILVAPHSDHAMLNVRYCISRAFRPAPPILRTLAVVLLAWLVFSEIVVESWYRFHEFRAASAQTWSVQWPSDKPGFERVEPTPYVRKTLAYDEGGQCVWTEPDGTLWQMYYFRWWPSHSVYARVKSELNKGHRPEICLTHAGMKEVADLGVGIYSVGGQKFAMRKYIFESDGKLLRVFHAIYEDSASPEFLASDRANPLQRIAAAWAGSRNYGLRILGIAISGDLDEQQADLAVRHHLETLIQVAPTARN